jgi:hypothetical protein
METHSSAAPTPQPHEPEREVDLSRAAAGWCVALIAGIAIATGSAAYDKARRESLERAVENTAVGDSRYYSLSSATPVPLLYEGAPLVVADKTPVPMPDARMRLTGYTDDAQLRLYVPQERENGNGTTGGPSWYVKAGPGSFLRTTR